MQPSVFAKDGADSSKRRIGLTSLEDEHLLGANPSTQSGSRPMDGKFEYNDEGSLLMSDRVPRVIKG